MSGFIITVAQQKGGAGKTTLVAHLAAHWAGQGRRVALVDVDPQGSLTAWHGMRTANDLRDLHLASISGWRVAHEVERLKREFDLVLIDSPPHAESDAKMAIRAADLVVLPVQLSPMDLWATGATIEIAFAARRPLLLVLNRVAPRGHLGDKIRGLIAESKMPFATQTLGNRQVFASALLQGRGVTEVEPHGPASVEIGAVAQELWRKLVSP